MKKLILLINIKTTDKKLSVVFVYNKSQKNESKSLTITDQSIIIRM